MDDLFSLPEYTEQEELLRLDRVPTRVDSVVPHPVARIVVDVPHSSVDTLFDYLVPEKFADVPVGARVAVDFGSSRVHGFIVARVDESEFSTSLRPIRKVISTLPVLDEEIYSLAQAVAQRQCSTVAACLRLAIPQRHARAEKEFLTHDYPENEPVLPPETSRWDPYESGPEFLAQLAGGKPVRALLQARSVDNVVAMAADAVAATLASGKTALIVVATSRQVAVYAKAIEQLVNVPVATFLGEDSPAVRYQTFLAIKAGYARVVVGTRSAAWMPVQDLGLAVIVDDYHSAHEEQHRPYLHTRELLRLRSELAGASFLGINYGPSVALAWQAQNSWVAITPRQRRDPHAVPQVLAASALSYEGEHWLRMPSSVFRTVRAGLEHGNVLIVVPRTGYMPIVACTRCRELARCASCDGTLKITGPDQPPQCSRCGVVVRDFKCRHCRGRELKPARIGSHRTAQEIGRAFRGITIQLAGEGDVTTSTSDEHVIVVSTVGNISYLRNKFAAAVVLDAGFMLRSQHLDSEVYFLRALAQIATRVVPRAEDGQLLIVGDVPADLILTVKNWNMFGWATKALRERAELSLPPASVWCHVQATMPTMRKFLAMVQALAQQAHLETSEQPLAALLGAGVAEMIPGMRIVGPYPGRDDDELALYLSFSHHDRTVITELITQAYRTIVVQKQGKITIKMDTSA